ncbi:MAG: flavodoxin family protein [Alphaproteobacteria bacterium]|nr:flavodoxin family protein [Alphaproteobacteria bacterium]
MKKIVVVYYSGYGHTAKVADSVRQGALRVEGTQVDLIKTDEIENKWEILNAADAIIFGAPTYMGSLAAPFKVFMESSSKLWAQEAWKDKIAGGFTNSSSQNGAKMVSLIELMTFAMQHGMIWVGLGILPGNNTSKGSINDINRLGSFAGAMTQANNDQGPDEAPPPSDRETAALLGQRIARFLERLNQR